MNRDSANASRLRVNRMALIQQLDAHDLVPKLVRARILSMDYDVPYINQGTSRIDRARRLVDCLLAPTSTDAGTPRHDRSGNWYLKFRTTLLENPAAYSDLVVALDNTIIRTPDFAQHVSEAFADKTNAPRAQEFRDTVNRDLLRTSEAQAGSEPKKTPSAVVVNQEQITKIEFDPYARNKILIEGNFQKVIDNLTYHSQVGARTPNRGQARTFALYSGSRTFAATVIHVRSSLRSTTTRSREAGLRRHAPTRADE